MDLSGHSLPHSNHRQLDEYRKHIRHFPELDQNVGDPEQRWALPSFVGNDGASEASVSSSLATILVRRLLLTCASSVMRESQIIADSLHASLTSSISL